MNSVNISNGSLVIEFLSMDTKSLKNVASKVAYNEQGFVQVGR